MPKLVKLAPYFAPYVANDLLIFYSESLEKANQVKQCLDT